MIPDLSAGAWIAIMIGAALWVGAGWTFFADFAERFRGRHGDD